SVLRAAGAPWGAVGRAVGGARDVLEPAGMQARALGDGLREAPAAEAAARGFATDADPLLRAAGLAARRLAPASAQLQRAVPAVLGAERAAAGMDGFAAAALEAAPP